MLCDSRESVQIPRINSRGQNVEINPQCAAYTIAACPMVAGRLDHYRSTPRRLDATMTSAPDSAARQGSSAEPWFAVWLDGYQVVTDHGNLAASYADRRPLRFRSITWRLPGIP
jgi:hypothetical protein